MNLHNQQKIIKNKLGLLNLAHELGSVSRACKVFGYSRDSFYRFLVLALSLRKNFMKNMEMKVVVE